MQQICGYGYCFIATQPITKKSESLYDFMTTLLTKYHTYSRLIKPLVKKVFKFGLIGIKGGVNLRMYKCSMFNQQGNFKNPQKCRFKFKGRLN